MFEDARSKRVVLVAHCVLNQNAKLDRCASYPGAVHEVAQVLVDSGAGIVQMPCPELHCLGLDRQAEPGTRATVEEEDARIARRLEGDDERAGLEQLVDGLVYQIEEYLDNGFTIEGVVGMDGSPSCGVGPWAEGEGPGALIEMLTERLAANGIDIPMKGINARQPREAVEVVGAMVENEGGEKTGP